MKSEKKYRQRESSSRGKSPAAYHYWEVAEEEEAALETEKEHPVKEKENQEAWCPRGLENEVFQKEVNPGNSLVNQWLGLNIFTALAWVQSLVGELISHELSNAGKKKLIMPHTKRWGRMRLQNWILTLEKYGQLVTLNRVLNRVIQINSPTGVSWKNKRWWRPDSKYRQLWGALQRKRNRGMM